MAQPWRKESLVGACLAVALACGDAHGKPPPNEIPLNCPAKFITALVPDGYGGVWAAGEDAGIWPGTLTGDAHCDGRLAVQAQWKRPGGIDPSRNHKGATTAAAPLSKFITALCVDGAGRLWVGTNRHGVYVFNGRSWAHYGIVSGPLGCHVYAIAWNAAESQVWIATENGISIYRCSNRPRRVTCGSRLAVPLWIPKVLSPSPIPAISRPRFV